MRRYGHVGHGDVGHGDTEVRRKLVSSCSPGLCASVASFSVANTAMNAIEAREAHKVYGRSGRRKQFATLVEDV